MNSGPKDSWQRDLLLLFLGIGLFFCLGLSYRAYITPSEARYIEIPRQMLASGDWLTPHINGVQYFEKPPLFYWMQAIFLGISYNEFFGRIATTLVVTLTCLLTYATGRLLYSREAGLLAATALATSVLGYGLSRVAMLDAPVTLFLTATISSFIFAQKTRDQKYYYTMYAAAALAVMTKGLIGIVIPGMVIGAWIALTKNWKILLEAKLVTGTLLFLAITAPWHIAMQLKHPEFFDFYFIHEHFTRFLTNEHKRTAPWWFFIAVTLVGSMPWLGIVASGKWQVVRKKKLSEYLPLTTSHFLLLWILLPLIFFSSSHSKLVPYIFPIFPPLFILIGKQLAAMWPRRERLIKNTMVTMAFICILANFIAPYFDQRTIRPLAETLSQKLTPDDMVVAYNSYWQDIPVYLKRNITVAGWTGELAFGTAHTPNANEWMLDIDSFWQKCAQEKNSVYVFMNNEDFMNLKPYTGCELHELSRYGRTLLLKNGLNR